MKTRTLLQIYILDDDGEVLADVDHHSTCAALAYYLTTRHIDENATEQTVFDGTGTTPGAHDQVSLVQRHAITNHVERSFTAQVHR